MNTTPRGINPDGTQQSFDSDGATDLAALRISYERAGFDVADADPDPIVQFRRWFEDFRAAGVAEPNAMVVTTATLDGIPSSRMLLLKGVDERGFAFFTNLGSRKGDELSTNPHCALLFPWHQLERQVRIEGAAAPVSREEVDAYFATRPRGSQIGAWASRQSHEVADRQVLAEAYDSVAERFGESAPIPAPDFWGGFIVRPEVMEFWQGRPGRMHDRVVYRRDGDTWTRHRLAP